MTNFQQALQDAEEVRSSVIEQDTLEAQEREECEHLFAEAEPGDSSVGLGSDHLLYWLCEDCGATWTTFAQMGVE